MGKIKNWSSSFSNFFTTESLLNQHKFNGFPVIVDQASQILAGFVTRRDIKVALRKSVLLCMFRSVIVEMQNICNLIGWNSVHFSDIFNYYSANINGMWNKKAKRDIQIFESILTSNMHV